MPQITWTIVTWLAAAVSRKIDTDEYLLDIFKSNKSPCPVGSLCWITLYTHHLGDHCNVGHSTGVLCTSPVILIIFINSHWLCGFCHKCEIPSKGSDYHLTSCPSYISLTHAGCFSNHQPPCFHINHQINA